MTRVEHPLEQTLLPVEHRRICGALLERPRELASLPREFGGFSAGIGVGRLVESFTIKDQGNLTSLKVPPFLPEGFDPKVAKVWVPQFPEFATLRDKWIEEWNTVYGYRQ